MNRISASRFTAVCLFLFFPVLALGQSLRFVVSYPASTFAGPFTGRAIVALSKQNPEPRFGPNWFAPEPMVSRQFRDIKPGTEMVIGDDAVAFPDKLSKLSAGDYFVQAVLDRNLGGRQFGGSPGNLYNKAVKVHLDPSQGKPITIVCNLVVEEPKFQETATTKEFKVESRLLSKFYGRPTYIKAGVALPTEWTKDPGRTFPVIYEVPGFGGTHYNLSEMRGERMTRRAGVPFIYVMLNPDCPTGHSVFADSANNGPWGAALTTELIPALEKRFRGSGQASGRFVTGHSSGGWSSLWLQVTYPEVFGGCWSTSPDPVDFRAFQLIDLYDAKSNMFTDKFGKPVPLARQGLTPVLFYQAFSNMERPIRGEQLGSFEAVFSPKGTDGEPRKLWNRATGAIDPVTVEAWKKYDIGLNLRTHWKELSPKLAGKIHVYMGETDTFYLDPAVRLLQADMKKIGADAVIEMVPGDHGSMMTRELRERIDKEIAAQVGKKR